MGRWVLPILVCAISLIPIGKSHAPVRSDAVPLSAGAIRAVLPVEEKVVDPWIVSGVDGLYARAGVDADDAAPPEETALPIEEEKKRKLTRLIFLPASARPFNEQVASVPQEPITLGHDGSPPTRWTPDLVAFTGGGVGGGGGSTSTDFPFPPEHEPWGVPPSEVPPGEIPGGETPGSGGGGATVPEPACLSLLGFVAIAFRRPDRGRGERNQNARSAAAAA